MAKPRSKPKQKQKKGQDLVWHEGLRASQPKLSPFEAQIQELLQGSEDWDVDRMEEKVDTAFPVTIEHFWRKSTSHADADKVLEVLSAFNVFNWSPKRFYRIIREAAKRHGYYRVWNGYYKDPHGSDTTVSRCLLCQIPKPKKKEEREKWVHQLCPGCNDNLFNYYVASNRGKRIRPYKHNEGRVNKKPILEWEE